MVGEMARVANADSQQLLDALTDHLAVYHRCMKKSKSGTASGASARKKVVQWMSELSVEQRQATLTILNRPWLTLVLQMQKRLETEGPGNFFVLPDVRVSETTGGACNQVSKTRPRRGSSEPSQDLQISNSSAHKFHTKKKMPSRNSPNYAFASQSKLPLPSLCFRRSKGLLQRLSKQEAAGEFLLKNLQIFSSQDGEPVEIKSDGFHPLDTLSVREELVENLDLFLAIMDEITAGEFLCSISGGGTSSWEEVNWLKAMGYYSLQAFIANNLELAIWSAWIHSQGMKCSVRTSTGSIMKELRRTGQGAHIRTSDTQVTASTLSVVKRHKGFMNSWIKENSHVRSRVAKYAFAQVVKAEVKQLMTVASMQKPGKSKTKSCENAYLKMHFSDNDSEEQFQEVDDLKSSNSHSFLCGLRAIKWISTSHLQFVFSEGEDGVQERHHDWLFYSSLDSASSLLDRITRRVRNTLIKAMKDSMELELLGSQIKLDQSVCNNVKRGDVKGKKDKKRRKSRNQVQGTVPTELETGVTVLGSEISKELLQGHASQVMNGKKKKQLQVKLTTEHPKKAAQGKGENKKVGNCKESTAKENCLTFPSDKTEANQGCCLEHRKKENSKTDITPKTYTCMDVPNTACCILNVPESVCWDVQMVASSGAYSSDSQQMSHSKVFDTLDSEMHRDAFSLSITPGTESTIDKHVSECGNSIPLSSFDVMKCCPRFSQNVSLDCLDKGNTRNEISSQNLSSERDTPGLQVELLRSPHCCDNFCGTIEPSTGSENINELSVSKLEKFEPSKTLDNMNAMEVHCGSSPGSEKTQALPCESSCTSLVIRDDHDQLECWKAQSLHAQHSLVFGLTNSHEWPRSVQAPFPDVQSPIQSAAAGRLHLDVDRNWPQCIRTPLVALKNCGTRQQSGSGSSKRIVVTQRGSKSLDWPPIFQSGFNLAQTMGYSYGYNEEPGLIPFTQPTVHSGFLGTDLNWSGRVQEDVKNGARTPDDTDYDDSNCFSWDFDDCDGCFISEEEGEKHFVDLSHNFDSDFNKIFGGGVMYWNAADYAGPGYSRPPSLSSEDSTWARHEADLGVVLDDIMGFSAMPGSFANGVAPTVTSSSPPAVPCHSSLDHSMPTSTSHVCLPRSGNEISGKLPAMPTTGLSIKTEDEPSNASDVIGVVEGISGDNVTRPVLRPLIVVRDRKLPISDSVRYHEPKSPHIARAKREPLRLKRPPSPVLRCVPRAPPPPPPPSPVGSFRKQRGLTTVRSGSSSPRHWGVASLPNREELGGKDLHMKTRSPEATGTAWISRSITNTSPVYPISGVLLRERLIVLPGLAMEQEHPDAALPMQNALLFDSNPPLQPAITKLHSVLHEEIDVFCKQVAAENLLRKPFINTAVRKVAHAMQVLWPRSRLKIFGSNATGLALPCSDVDLVVCLPPVRNLEPIKEAGILEGRNGIKETCLQQAARYLADQDWVKSDSLKTIENTAIPIIMVVADVPSQPYNVNALTLNGYVKDRSQSFSPQTNWVNETRDPWGGKADRELVHLDISFEAPSHTGLRTAELVQELIGQFPAIVPLALVLKQFLTDRSLDHPYTGGLSSYCLVLLMTRFLQHQHHLGWPFQQNLGSLLMDFLHFFGCVFDPRQTGICIRGGGRYLNRDRGHSIDPLHIEDPLHPSNNVGRNCFRILQCLKAFADAYSYLKEELAEIPESTCTISKGEDFRLLQKILPSISGQQ